MISNHQTGMSKVSFGIGGFGSLERRFIAEVEANSRDIHLLAEALQNCGFWTVLDSNTTGKKTTISYGEVIVQ